jgi:hypothetical protein
MVDPAAATGQAAPDNAVAQTAPVQQPMAQAIPEGGAVPPAPMNMSGTPSAPIAPNAAQAVSGPASPAMAGLPPPAAPSKQFMVGGLGFDTREAATKQAEKEAPTVMEFFVKQAVPKIQEGYLAQGDPAKAEARHVFKLYQNYDDGVTPLSHESVKNKDGQVTGFNVKLKDDATGEERSQFIDKEALVEMGLSALSPPAMFELQYKKQSAADAARMAAASAELKDARTLGRDLVKEGVKSNNALTLADKRIAADKEKATAAGDQRIKEIDLQQTLRNAGLGRAEKAKIEAKVEALRGAGYDDEQVNGMMPALLGTGEYKKTTDPTERRALIATELMKSDPSFARADSAKQAEKVDQMMSTIYGAKPAKGSVPNPVDAGARPAGKAGAKKTGVPVFDPVSKSIVYR